MVVCVVVSLSMCGCVCGCQPEYVWLCVSYAYTLYCLGVPYGLNKKIVFFNFSILKLNNVLKFACVVVYVYVCVCVKFCVCVCACMCEYA